VKDGRRRKGGEGRTEGEKGKATKGRRRKECEGWKVKEDKGRKVKEGIQVNMYLSEHAFRGYPFIGHGISDVPCKERKEGKEREGRKDGRTGRKDGQEGRTGGRRGEEESR
jgi:hypothetical protein